MVIYIEIAILDNMIINSVLLFFSAKIFKLHTTKLNIFLGALCGTVGALFFPLINLPILIMLPLKCILGLLCVCFTLKTKKIREIIKCFFVFLAVTFSFGGVVFGVFNLLNIDANLLSVLNGNFTLPAGMFFGVFVLFIYLIRKLISVINVHKKVAGYLFCAKLTCNNKTVETAGYLDSGNRLRDKASGRPINIITFSLFEKFYGEEAMFNILNKHTENLNLKDAHFVPYATVSGGTKEMFVYSAPLLELETDNKKTKIENALFGVVFKKFNDVVSYDILLNSETI